MREISEKITDVINQHPKLESIVVHAGSYDVPKKQSEILKKDFSELLQKLQGINKAIFISGPIPSGNDG